MSAVFAVAAVRVRASNRLDVLTSVAGDAVDAADPTDCLSPSCWALAAAGLSVVRVESATPSNDNALGWTLYLDGDLPASAGLSLALSSEAHSRYGEVTDTTPLVFSGASALPIVDATLGAQGADLALPLAPDATGDLSMLGRVDAFRERLERLVETSQGRFRHIPAWGRGIEPKRNHSDAAIQLEARQLKAQILADPDARDARVAYRRITGGVVFDIQARSRTGDQVTVSGSGFTAGESA